MNPIVTIGIPCYNAGRWIEACVRSALAQDWPEKEVIVVDDGSTDASREILHGFGDAIRLVEGGHRGSNRARNEVLRLARGEWVQFLDADDYLMPQKISRQLAGARNCDAIYSPVWIENATTGTRELAAIDPRADIYTQWLAWQMPQTGGCLWLKSALEKIGGWNEAQPCCQEHELYLRALKNGLRFSFAPAPDAVYRIWSEETLCRRDPRQVVHVKTALMEDLRAWMCGRGLWQPCHAAAAAQAFFELSRTLAKYDLAEAAAYHAAHKRDGMMNATGPAAPPAYRLFYKALGFSNAEKIARILR
jgi:hypothetical protein